jgi:hypothetical protein
MSDLKRSSEAASPAITPAPPWSEVTALSDTHYRIRLGGTFGSAWLANMCRGLAGQRLSIERAHAMRAQHGAWSAELHVIALPGAPHPERLPLMQLLAAEVQELGELRIDAYELTASTAHGGTLHLVIEAEDTLGLLGSLLAQLARLALFPIEMHIETRRGRAEDSLWLCTHHGARPPQELQTALEQVLIAAIDGD